MKSPIHIVLFDLDGTLLDTAPDLVFALNLIRQEQQLSPLPLQLIRPIANLGSRAMIKAAFDIREDDPVFSKLRDQFLGYYEQNIANSTQFFPNIDKVLTHLDDHDIPWGIVTNKPSRHTRLLLDALNLDKRAACIIAGDTLPYAKPHPEPILHACRLLKESPANCIFVGDAATDVTASKAAGSRALVALYGYLQANDDPYSWQADGYIHDPSEIIEWLAKHPRQTPI